MLVYYLLKLLIVIGGAFTGFFGRVDVLPLGIDAVLSTAVGYFIGIFDTIPYLEIVWTSFKWIILFEIALKVLVLVFGSRSPVKHPTN